MATTRDLSGNDFGAVDKHVARTGDTATRVEDVTPSDSVNFAYGIARAVYVTGGGNVVIVRGDGTTVTYTGVPDDTVLDVRCKRINSTSTTATGIKAYF